MSDTKIITGEKSRKLSANLTSNLFLKYLYRQKTQTSIEIAIMIPYHLISKFNNENATGELGGFKIISIY